MKKLFKMLTATFAFSLIAFGAEAKLNTSYAAESPKRLELGYPTPNAAFTEKTISLTQSEAQKKELIEAVKKIRAKAWDEDVYYTFENDNTKNQKLRDVAFEAGLRNKEAYVNAINWNKKLEEFAIQRTYEILITDFGYFRPDGSDPENDYKKLGGSYVNELNALSFDGISPQMAVDIWSTLQLKSTDNKSEYDYLLMYKGAWVFEASDLHDLLDPYLTDFGYAQIAGPVGGKSYASMLVANDMKSQDRSVTGYVGNYKLYVGDPNAKPLSAASKKSLREAINSAQMQLNVVNNLMENYPKTVASVKDKLEAMMEESYSLQLKAYGMLGEFEQMW